MHFLMMQSFLSGRDLGICCQLLVSGVVFVSVVRLSSHCCGRCHWSCCWGYWFYRCYWRYWGYWRCFSWFVVDIFLSCCWLLPYIIGEGVKKLIYRYNQLQIYCSSNSVIIVDQSVSKMCPQIIYLFMELLVKFLNLREKASFAEIRNLWKSMTQHHDILGNSVSWFYP